MREPAVEAGAQRSNLLYGGGAARATSGTSGLRPSIEAVRKADNRDGLSREGCAG